tara:strand:+ start:2906 stop:3571 length:666 start_codon:yes stop_codon:yes gene_type:complete
LELLFSSEQKIKNITDTNEIANLVNYLNVLLNVKKENQLNDIEQSVLNGVIISQFSNYTVNELKNAFRLAVANKLGVEMFNKLDSLVFGKVLKAYAKHKSTIIQAYNATKKIALPDVNKEKLNKLALKEFIKEYKINHDPNGAPIISTPAERVFLHYLAAKKIYLTPGEKQKFISMAEVMLRMEKREQRTKKKQFRLNSDPKAMVKNYARCIALHYKFLSI